MRKPLWFSDVFTKQGHKRSHLILPTHSRLHQLSAPDAFWWSVGIEDSFVATPWPATGRAMDEYELTDHYARYREDIDLMASLNIPCARYGVPWHRIQPTQSTWDWDWSERAIDYLLERDIEPILDLVHYGVPSWMAGAFIHPDYPQRVAEFAHHFGEKFKGRIHWWTPLNEPRITAWFCGKTGTWPPNRKSWHGFIEVLLPICRGIVECSRVLGRVDAENVICHVDAANNWLPPLPDEPFLHELTKFREDLMFLSLDLVTGRVDENHDLYRWLLRHGALQSTLDWFQENAIELDVIGVNAYPMLSQKQYVRTPSGKVRIRFPYGGSTMLERIMENYWNRYQRPMMIAETAGRGRVSRRMQWLRDSTVGVKNLRERSVPVVGYTWWPMFDLVSWAYRQSRAPLQNFLVPMGLWELDCQTLDRNPTALVEAYRELVQSGAASVGDLRV